MRIALAQINPVVGDLAGNGARIAKAAREAASRGAELAVFPELSITGYPPRDLVEKPSFVERSERQLAELASETADLDLSIVCGYVARSPSPDGKRALNRAAVLEAGQVVFRQRKCCCRTTTCSMKRATSSRGDTNSVHRFAASRIALTICEDAWNDKQILGAPPLQPRSGGGAVRSTARGF